MTETHEQSYQTGKTRQAPLDMYLGSRFIMLYMEGLILPWLWNLPFL